MLAGLLPPQNLTLSIDMHTNSVEHLFNLFDFQIQLNFRNTSPFTATLNAATN